VSRDFQVGTNVSCEHSTISAHTGLIFLLCELAVKCISIWQLLFTMACYFQLVCVYAVWYGGVATIVDNSDISHFPNSSVLVAVSRGIWALKLGFKNLHLSTGSVG